MTTETPAHINPERVPTLARGYRLQHDKVRNLWLIQAPERALVLEGAAPEIMKLVDGSRTANTIIETLVAQYDAPHDLIAQDVYTLFADLTQKGALRA
ncbi:pyrrolo-quinoline quinone synthesis protein PqqD [Neokomagataea thailandica NBRC 106555]|uniref:Pyrroloquinoline quinone biosynthesis peptide chaperone PqqD n=2 Tax=Neokomagataea TaxID=1223423 RepID=A0A4Y6V721_9PROT|nr:MULTISPECIES: pyrroloquinoline quinone biosynthesis peptide chaperone PqqD [Neokomagataea]QDH24658.1 pyrroloquinoline quinone biosynthesis peptide chaperone PqqD [Neokomagataea tanensis]GBR53918.1 pyrrolo-quinoline quinone synthesis protein PqqD [Neokomagataea thailandica NBRC 106555]